MTQRMLTKQLREMEQDGLSDRKVFAEVPPCLEYSLTPKGRSLKEIVQALEAWGRQQNDGSKGRRR